MVQKKNVRTRYAPSPTGFFHIGGARTALLNYLFAKHYNGDFIVRMEDTDVERNVINGISSQLDGLSWLGITPDESPNNEGKYGPYIQTKKLLRYKELAYKLLDEKKAYLCFCTAEELEHAREEAIKNSLTPKYNRKCANLSKKIIEENINKNIPFVIRLKIDDDATIAWDDMVRGKMIIPTSALTDPVILKSSGIPTYNFAVVVDDFDMKISHVLRGEEHLSNTPYQIAIKNALGFENDIEYGHLSIIVDETGKKLSKRNKELKQFISDYIELGFLPEAIVNFLSLLGWSPNTNSEIFSLNELIKIFDYSRISKAPAFFDIKKMMWISNEYFKKMVDKEYLIFTKKYIDIDLRDRILLSKNESIYDNLLLIFKNQISHASELNNLIKDLIFNNFSIDFIDNFIVEIGKDIFYKNMISLKNELNKYDEINFENASKIIDDVKKNTNLKGKELYMPIRMIAICKEHSPELNKVLTFIGKDKIISNIKNIEEKIFKK